MPEELADPLSPYGSGGNRQHGACYGGEGQGHGQGEQEVNTQEADIRGMEILDDENDRRRPQKYMTNAGTAVARRPPLAAS